MMTTSKEFEVRYKTKGTYVIWDVLGKDVYRFNGDNRMYFGGEEDAEQSVRDNDIVMSVECLKQYSPVHYEEYLLTIDNCIESGEINLN